MFENKDISKTFVKKRDMELTKNDENFIIQNPIEFNASSDVIRAENYGGVDMYLV